MIRLSKTSKLDGIKSWSLEAVATCPAAKDKDGNLVAACSGCYATTGNYRYPNVKAPREHNREDWKREDWTRDMITALSKEKYFRWFDSGDMYSPALAEKILDVMISTPNVKHWIPSKMFKFAKFQTIFDRMQALDNVAVRFSSDSIQGEYSDNHGSTIIPDYQFQTSAKVCHAYKKENNGKCKGCRDCWNKDIPVIAYVAHGEKMKRVIKNLGV